MLFSMDLETLLLVIVLLQMFQLLIIVVIGKLHPEVEGPRYWLAFNLWVALGFSMGFLLPYLPKEIPVILGNAALFVSALMMLLGVRSFRGFPLQWKRELASLCSFFAAFLVLRYLFEQPQWSSTVVSFCFVTLTLRTAWAIGHKPPQRVKKVFFSISTFLQLYVAWNLLLGLVSLFHIYPEHPPQSNPLLMLALVAMIVFSFGWTFSIVLMVTQKLTLLLHEKQQILEQLATEDPLTTAFNRRYFEEKMEEEVARFHRYEQPTSLLLLDLDHFKSINDNYGHPVGDQVLQWFVRLCREELREVDTLARVGGEEFAVLIPETDVEGVEVLVKRFQKKLQFPFESGTEEFHVTFSGGIAAFCREDLDAETIYKRADAALYQAKRNGRNRVFVFPSDREHALSHPKKRHEKASLQTMVSQNH